MGKILCSIRGGKEGYRTQDAAIALARERGDELVFLVVLDISFLHKSTTPHDTRAAVTRMGNSLLLTAAERARKAGIEAQTLLREGVLREQIKAAAREEGVTLVVLGRPQSHYDKFVAVELETFAREVADETGAEVTIV